MSPALVLATTAAIAAVFLAIGLAVARRHRDTVDGFIAARGQIGGGTAAATVTATMLGGWVLFSPAESAALGGVATVVGYALGTAAPLFAYLFLGRRLRTLMPSGHGLTDFVFHRYGGALYLATLGVMAAVLLIFLATALTAVGQVVGLVGGAGGGWLPAAIVLAAALGYTLAGGLRSSIATDAVQLAVILPLLALLAGYGWHAAGGAAALQTGLAERAPELLDPAHGPGLETAGALILAILAAEIFNQSYWQRVYAARDPAAAARGFLASGLVIIPVIAVMGAFGLFAVALGRADEAAVAAFVLIFEGLPPALQALGLLLGIALVMSSVDSLLSALSSLIAVELPRAAPRLGDAAVRGVARLGIVLLALPCLAVAAQGYSIFYLLLVADLICAAAAIPVFLGLYSRRWHGREATAAFLGGLGAGAMLFPPPGFGPEGLLFLVSGGAGWAEAGLWQAFAAAALVSAALATLLFRRRRRGFDFTRLARVGETPPGLAGRA